MLKKILCLGNNDYSTDTQTSKLALESNTQNHGLITDRDFVPSSPGYYHTTIVDIPIGSIIAMSRYFDQVIMLDQPAKEWSNWKILLSTYKLMCQLELNNVDTAFRNNQNIKNFEFFTDLVKTNPSFCLYPWVNFVEEDGYLNLCAHSSKQIKAYSDLLDWNNDPDYNHVRQNMLEGNRLEDYCEDCYRYEDKGIESYRQFETLEWVAKLSLNNLDDLQKIEHPYFYEMQVSNTCNIKCRSCSPRHSTAIKKEFTKHNIDFNIYGDTVRRYIYGSVEVIDIDNLTPLSRVYLQGGEPTVMPETVDFMKNCINKGKTDFEFSICTNGQRITKEFVELCEHFPGMNFTFSLDGYGKINDYWRSGTDWDTVINNARMLHSKGFNITINTVPGIYNVTNLHLLFEFLDKEFPKTSVYLQLNFSPMQSAFNHPNTALVIESLEKCKQTGVYYSDGKSVKSCIDELYDYYTSLPVCNLENLQQFFKFNDRLDEIRNVKLADYIPELEECRRLI